MEELVMVQKMVGMKAFDIKYKIFSTNRQETILKNK